MQNLNTKTIVAGVVGLASTFLLLYLSIIMTSKSEMTGKPLTTGTEPFQESLPDPSQPVEAKNLTIPQAQNLINSNRTSTCGTKVLQTREERARSTKECKITQVGTDGFGHQFEGKLSLVVLDLISDKFSYIHTPVFTMQHTPLSTVARAENFTDLAALFPTQRDVEIAQKIPLKVQAFRVPQATVAFFAEVLSGERKCEKNVIYSVDNAWSVVYKTPPFDRMFDDCISGSRAFQLIRETYFKSPKPATGFFPNRPNVVVHIRRGDIVGIVVPGHRHAAGPRYYINGMIYYNYTLTKKYGKPPAFFIETDDPDWEAINEIRAAAGEHSIFSAPSDWGMLSSFHRMVVADGLVTSASSFSRAAAVLNKAENPIVANSAMSNRRYFTLDRYVYLSESEPLNVSLLS